MNKFTPYFLTAALLATMYGCDKKPSSSNTPSSSSSSTANGGNYLCEVVVDSNQASNSVKKEKKAVTFDSSEIQEPLEHHKKNSLESGVLSVYYTTNSWALYDNDKKDILNFLKSVEKGSTIVLEGYADNRGSDKSNMNLGQARINGIAAQIKFIRPDIKITKANYGEGKSQQEGIEKENLWKDRKVRLVADKSVIAAGLDSVVSDFYLLDKSGSMRNGIYSGTKEVPKWSEVQKYQFPKGATAYTFPSGKCTGKLPNEIPDGETPLYKALRQLLDKTPNGKTITVLTDGADTAGGDINDIVSTANNKNVSISFVGIGLDSQYQKVLEGIATKTGGRVYMTQK